MPRGFTLMNIVVVEVNGVERTRVAYTPKDGRLVVYYHTAPFTMTAAQAIWSAKNTRVPPIHEMDFKMRHPKVYAASERQRLWPIAASAQTNWNITYKKCHQALLKSKKPENPKCTCEPFVLNARGCPSAKGKPCPGLRAVDINPYL